MENSREFPQKTKNELLYNLAILLLDIFQIRYAYSQLVHKKVFSITNHQGNANQITMRYHLTPVRMGIFKKSRNNKCRWGCREKGTLMHCWWECKLVQPLWRPLKKLKIELPYDPAIPHFWVFIQRKQKH